MQCIPKVPHEQLTFFEEKICSIWTVVLLLSPRVQLHLQSGDLILELPDPEVVPTSFPTREAPNGARHELSHERILVLKNGAHEGTSC